jgi:hypothetical protein
MLSSATLTVEIILSAALYCRVAPCSVGTFYTEVLDSRIHGGQIPLSWHNQAKIFHSVSAHPEQSAGNKLVDVLSKNQFSS